jgi:ribose/xylose/arabinose/galactoside ABC-type transport system permease subunit
MEVVRRGSEASGLLKAKQTIQRMVALREFGVLLALVVFLTVATVSSSQFRTPYNISTILRQASVVAIVAAGQTLVIISGAFDLSQAPVAGLTAMVTALVWRDWGFPPPLAILFGLAVSTGCGVFNGVLAARFRLHPIVMTLATSAVFLGLNYTITKGDPIHGLAKGLLWLGYADIGPVPVSAIVMLLVCITMHIMLTRTILGLRILMLGGSLKATKDLGIDVDRVRVVLYSISGFLAGLGGIVLLGRVGNAIVTIGSGLMFPSVTAAILGGTLLSGGVGSMLGTLMGAAIMAVVNNSLVIFKVGIYVQDIAQGALVLVALLIDQIRRGELSWAAILGKEW